MTLETNPPFRPIVLRDGYLPIADHGLIGDGITAALVGRNGSVNWLCVPRFDSPPLFCELLDARRGGAFAIAPESLVESRQYYLPDSGVLVTELRSPDGLVQITDALTLQSGASLNEGVSCARGELLRSVKALEGTVRLQIRVEPRGGASVAPRGGGLRLGCRGVDGVVLQLDASRPLDGPRSTLEMAAGDRVDFQLRWQAGSYRYHAIGPDETLRATVDVWRRWLEAFAYRGPQETLVRRSAITLKLLDYVPNGAIVAAPTSSLPEAIGGPRNWDYRYSWIRDAAFSVYALRRIGLSQEAWAFLGWVLDDVESQAPSVLYTLDGGQPDPEREDDELEGYRGSRPVRWGNGAADQTQHDVYGEILDCAYQWVAGGGDMPERLWDRLRGFVEAARQKWRTPDHGIWEVRTDGRLFTYSVALCQVALDRGARLASQLGLPGDVHGWRREAEEIRQAILSEAWDESAQSLTENLGEGSSLDASLLSLPLRRVVPADHPQMVATCKAVCDRLGAGEGLIYRYLPDESPDGLEGDEGAFLLCSFWLVDNWAKQGRIDEARELYDSLCARANCLGLLPEQIDPTTGEFLGNFPQAFSHVGLISSGMNLDRLSRQRA